MKQSLQNLGIVIFFFIAATILLGVARELFHREHNPSTWFLLVVGFLAFQVCAVLFGIMFREVWNRWKAKSRKSA